MNNNNINEEIPEDSGFEDIDDFEDFDDDFDFDDDNDDFGK